MRWLERKGLTSSFAVPPLAEQLRRLVTHVVAELGGFVSEKHAVVTRKTKSSASPGWL
jgi:hypothetical protein